MRNSPTTPTRHDCSTKSSGLGLFVDMLDAPVRTLRLHDLFREALQRRLQLDRPDDWRALMQRAAALESDPLRHRRCCSRHPASTRRRVHLLRDGTELNISGAVPTTLRLVDAFPAHFVAGNAELQRVSGIAKISVWRFQEAERHFVQAEALYAARGDTGAAQSMAARRAPGDARSRTSAGVRDHRRDRCTACR